ncbi:unnamed protein product [Gongylonema pulchrum]|uniref:Cryptochrome_C domain-containing protein n=1 Tax=Gongylonema pulchrum TaxID=637853 RepID=A0A183D748_9BILA|nr:unnamed protein product [Gongylonema pulchrum]
MLERLNSVGEDAWSRAADGTLSDSWKNGQTSYHVRSSISDQRQSTQSQQAHSVGPWQDPKMLNVLGQSSSQANSM